MAVLYDGKEARLLTYNKKLFDITPITGGLRVRQEPYTRRDTLLSKTDKLPFRGINISESADIYVSYRGKQARVPNYVSMNSTEGNSITWAVNSFKNGEFICYTYPSSTTTPIIGFTKYSHFVADGTNVGKCLFAMYILNNVVYITETGCDWFTLGSVSFTSGSNCYQIVFRAQEDKLVLIIDDVIIYQFITPFQGWFRPCVMSLPSSTSTEIQTIGFLDYLVMSPLPCYLKEYDNYVYNGTNIISTELNDGSFLTSTRYAGNMLAANSSDTALNGRSQQKRYGDMYLRECQEPVSYHFTYNRFGTMETDIDSEFALLKESDSLLYGTILQDSDFLHKSPKSKLYLYSEPVSSLFIPGTYTYDVSYNRSVTINYTSVEGDSFSIHSTRVNCASLNTSYISPRGIITPRLSYEVKYQDTSDIAKCSEYSDAISEAYYTLSDNIDANDSAWNSFNSAYNDMLSAQDEYYEADNELQSAADDIPYRENEIEDTDYNLGNAFDELVWALNQYNNYISTFQSCCTNFYEDLITAINNNGSYYTASIYKGSVPSFSWSSSATKYNILSSLSQSSTSISYIAYEHSVDSRFTSADEWIYDCVQIANGDSTYYGTVYMAMQYLRNSAYEMSDARSELESRLSYVNDCISAYQSRVNEYSTAVDNYNDAVTRYNNAVTSYETAQENYNDAFSNALNYAEGCSEYSTYYYTLQQYVEQYNSNLQALNDQYSSYLQEADSIAQYNEGLLKHKVTTFATIPIQDKDVVNIKLLPKQSSAQTYNQFRAIIDVNGYNIYQSSYETDFPPTLYLRCFENNMWSDISYTPLIGTSAGFIYNTNYIIDSTNYINSVVDNKLLYMNANYDTVYKTSTTTYKYKLVSTKRYSNALVTLYADTLSDNQEEHRLVTYGTDYFSFNPSCASDTYKMSTNTSVTNFNIAFEQSNNSLYYINNSGTSTQVTTLSKGDRIDILSYTAISTTPASRLYVYFEVYKNGVYISRYGSISLSQYSDRYFIGLSLKEPLVTLNGFKIKDLSPSSTDTYVKPYGSTGPTHLNNNAYVNIALNQNILSDGVYKNSSSSNGDNNALTLGLQFDYKTGFILQSTSRNVSSNCAEVGIRVQDQLGVYSDVSNYGRGNSANYICMNDHSSIGIIEAGSRVTLWTGYGDSDQYISASAYLPFSIYKPSGKNNFRYRHNGYEALSSNAVVDSSTNRFDSMISNWYGGGITSNVSFGLPSNVISTWQCARYVRCYSNGSSTNNGNYWYEVQAFDVNGVNVALNKSVTTNGSVTTESGGSLSYVTNGNSEDYYVAIGTGVKYVQIDLGKLYEIRKIKVWAYWNDGRTFHNKKVQISPDGTHWITVFDSDIQGEVAETSSGTTIII